MARKPVDFQWLGFNDEQIELLGFLDQIGDNGWARNSQTEALMPGLLGDLVREGVPLACVKRAMKSIGYGQSALHELDRWEAKRATGKFGR